MLMKQMILLWTKPITQQTNTARANVAELAHHRLTGLLLLHSREVQVSHPPSDQPGMYLCVCVTTHDKNEEGLDCNAGVALLASVKHAQGPSNCLKVHN